MLDLYQREDIGRNCDYVGPELRQWEKKKSWHQVETLQHNYAVLSFLPKPRRAHDGWLILQPKQQQLNPDG